MQSSSSLTTSSYNTVVGYQAGVSISTGNGFNVLLGYQTGKDITTGSYNTFAGRNAGQYTTTGVNNIAIGNIAYGWTTTDKTGSENVHIGYATNPSSASASSELVITAGANGATGKGNNTGFIDVTSGVYQGNNSSSWSTTSDSRIKKNIVDNTRGLDIINQIRVRNFEYRTVEEITDFDNPQAVFAKTEGVQLGVIAQEIKEYLPEVVKEETTGALKVDPDNITWYLVNAVKELSARLDAAGI